MAEIDPAPSGAALSAPTPISDQHDLSNFDCGKPSLNDWLKHRALTSERGARHALMSWRRACAWLGITASRRVPSSPRKRRVEIRRNMPDPIPVMIVGRLAVDKAFQGRHIGSAMLKDALRRILGVSQTVGARAVMVHALDDEAIAFYAGFGFRAFPPSSRTLFLSITEIAAALRLNCCSLAA